MRWFETFEDATGRLHLNSLEVQPNIAFRLKNISSIIYSPQDTENLHHLTSYWILTIYISFIIKLQKGLFIYNIKNNFTKPWQLGNNVDIHLCHCLNTALNTVWFSFYLHYLFHSFSLTLYCWCFFILFQNYFFRNWINKCNRLH